MPPSVKLLRLTLDGEIFSGCYIFAEHRGKSIFLVDFNFSCAKVGGMKFAGQGKSKNKINQGLRGIGLWAPTLAGASQGLPLNPDNSKEDKMEMIKGNEYKGILNKEYAEMPDSERRAHIIENIVWFEDHGFTETARAIREIFLEITKEAHHV